MVKMLHVIIAVVVLSLAGSPGFARAQVVATIDFQGLPEVIPPCFLPHLTIKPGSQPAPFKGRV